MHKSTENTINLFINKLNKSGVGVSFMQNEDIFLTPYTLPGETAKVKIV